MSTLKIKKMEDKYSKLAAKILSELSTIKPAEKKRLMFESRIVYEDGHDERMDPILASQLRDRTHSLGTHPIFPDSDETNFEEKLMSKRFADVLKAYKRHHGTEKIDVASLYKEQTETFGKTIKLEVKHKNELEALAIKLVRDEFDMDEAEVEIIAKLTTDISPKDIRQKPEGEKEFDNHDELSNANKEVYKRRFINAMIQGAAKKTNHMFHLIDHELEALEPLLPSYYSKLMTGADYAYMINNDSFTSPKLIGGKVTVKFPKTEMHRPKIIAEAMTLPVLIHELVKGVMEILSAHGMPEKPELAKYIMDKADYMAAETWDMRLGPPIWEKFIASIPPEDFKLKHHIFIELVSLPVDEFNVIMREIMMGSRTGKAKVLEIIKEIKDDLKSDEFDDAMSHLDNEKYFNPEDLDNIDDETWFM